MITNQVDNVFPTQFDLVYADRRHTKFDVATTRDFVVEFYETDAGVPGHRRSRYQNGA
jgi:hypothetical protein